MKTLIKNATIVNEGRKFVGSVLVSDGIIERVYPLEPLQTKPLCQDGMENESQVDVIDASGKYLLPGVIDDHVHFRDPGLTHKADMHTESLAAAAGGVTSVLDMPNVQPQTTTVDRWTDRMDIAKEKMHVNYGFFIGATNDNIDEIKRMPAGEYPGVKLFMGSSTGNMLVDREETLSRIFAESPTIIMAHCEDTARITNNMKEAKERYGDDPPVCEHPHIRDHKACYDSSALAVKLARRYCSRLHIAHITTREELELLDEFNYDNDHTIRGSRITGEACVAHLIYTDKDYERLGSKIKCNPSVKTGEDRNALRQALTDGRIAVVATDHAPHLLAEKEGGAQRAVSGMPMVQFSLVSMLELVQEGVLTIERLVELMCHNPALLFGIRDRGFVRSGMAADLVLVSRNKVAKEISAGEILSKCGWSPRVGDCIHWSVDSTWVNGELVWDGCRTYDRVKGQALKFENYRSSLQEG